MLETIKMPTDDRLMACGLRVGQRVYVPLAHDTGTIVAFGPAWHKGCTVKTRLDNVPGNEAPLHSCGNTHVKPLEQMLLVPCACGCKRRIDITDRWHYVRTYKEWFATPECFNETHPE